MHHLHWGWAISTLQTVPMLALQLTISTPSVTASLQSPEQPGHVQAPKIVYSIFNVGDHGPACHDLHMLGTNHGGVLVP